MGGKTAEALTGSSTDGSDPSNGETIVGAGLGPIAPHLEAIRSLCREYGVARLELFGSATTDAFDPASSDIDFIVEYPLDYEFGLWLTRYFELKERLEALLGRPVDLVMAGAIRKPRFIESLNESRRLLYAA